MAQKKNIVIIGGGVVGLFSAYYLRQAGHQVTILEKNDIGSGSSGGNAGLIVPSHFIPLAAPGMVVQGLKWMLNPASPFYIKPRFDLHLLSWLVRYAQAGTAARVRAAIPVLKDLNLASMQLYRELSGSLGGEFGYRNRGLLMLYKTPHAREAAVETAEVAEKIGLRVKVLTPADLSRLQPGVEFSVIGGIYYEDDGHLEPELLIRHVRARLDAMGVSIRTGTPVLSFIGRGDTVNAAVTPAGSVEAEEFILATGAWSQEVGRTLDLHLPMQPGRGYSITLPRVSASLTLPAILEEARVAVTPFDSSIRFAGTMELSGFATPPSKRRIDAILRAVPEYYGNVVSPEREKAVVWDGYRPCSPDGMPYIGRTRSRRNLVVATGHAMIGNSLGPVTGRIVSELIDGVTPKFNLALTNPDRYR
jgi:D-amino-acid dehydrogenase